MLKRLKVLSLRHLSSLSTYVRLGWPILALIAMITAIGFGILFNIAKEQNDTYRVSSRELVHQSLQAVIKSNSTIANDYGIWSDAFEATTVSLDTAWLYSNFGSASSSALAVFRPGEGVRYLSVESGYEASRAAISTFIGRLDVSAHQLYEDTKADHALVIQPNGFALIGGKIAAVSVSPIRPTKDNARQPIAGSPVDYAVAITFISAATISELSRSVSIDQIQLFIGSEHHHHNAGLIDLEIKDFNGEEIAYLEWRHTRPGSMAFDRRIGPLGLVLFMFGLIAIYVTQVIVLRQTRLSEAARLSAEEASTAKSTFLANMSHELRTPLNAIIGYSEMLEEDCLEADNTVGASDAKKVSRSAYHLLALINDLLDHSKIEAGKMDLNPTQVALTPIVCEVADALGMRAAENLSQIHVTCDPLLGDAIVDGMRLKQCLLNLVSNAAKFTQNGTISIAVRPVDYANVPFVRFSIKDTGIGMSAATLEKLFAPFVQADEATANKFGGTGLGLVITKRLVEAMGGMVSVTSVEGEGSCFTLLVPRGMAWTPAVEQRDVNETLVA